MDRTMNGEEIYQRIKTDIINLVLIPGTAISENELAKKYSVSRTPVKAAFLRLMSEHFIEVEPQRGTYVTKMDMEKIRDIIFMRTTLEREIFYEAIDHMDADLMDELRENLRQQRRLIERGSFAPRQFYELDSEMHRMVFEHEGRLKLWQIIQDFQVYYTRFRMLDIIATSAFAELVMEHEMLIDAVEKADKPEVARLLAAHLSGNIRRLEPRIEAEFSQYFEPTLSDMRGAGRPAKL